MLIGCDDSVTAGHGLCVTAGLGLCVSADWEDWREVHATSTLRIVRRAVQQSARSDKEGHGSHDGRVDE